MKPKGIGRKNGWVQGQIREENQKSSEGGSSTKSVGKAGGRGESPTGE